MSFLRHRTIWFVSAIVLLIILVACGGATAGEQTETSISSIGISDPASNVGGPQAPAFTVSTGGGSTFSLGDHDDEVVILYFSFPG